MVMAALARVCGAACLQLAAATSWAADDAPFGVNDIRLGTGYARLAEQLDFRDIAEALRLALGNKSGRPDLGKRGFGCMRRDDPFADIACVSHEEKVAGVETREVRLQFIEGRLQQFSMSAEVRYFDKLVAHLRELYGPPREASASGSGIASVVRWRNESSDIAAHRGENLAYVQVELHTYIEAVKRKREGVSLPECR